MARPPVFQKCWRCGKRTRRLGYIPMSFEPGKMKMPEGATFPDYQTGIGAIFMCHACETVKEQEIGVFDWDKAHDFRRSKRKRAAYLRYYHEVSRKWFAEQVQAKLE